MFATYAATSCAAAVVWMFVRLWCWCQMLWDSRGNNRLHLSPPQAKCRRGKTNAMSMFGFRRSSKGKLHINQDASPALEISSPTGFKHEIHVGFDSKTGEFKGLPPAWGMWLETSKIRYVGSASQTKTHFRNTLRLTNRLFFRIGY